MSDAEEILAAEVRNTTPMWMRMLNFRAFANACAAIVLTPQTWLLEITSEEQKTCRVQCGPILGLITADYVSNAVRFLFPGNKASIIEIRQFDRVVRLRLRASTLTRVVTSCGPCGGPHDVDVCPLRVCGHCKSKNHWERMCAKKTIPRK